MQRAVLSLSVLAWAVVATAAQSPSSPAPALSSSPSPAEVESAVRRLPAAYREAAGRYLHPAGANLAHIAEESDERWTDEAIGAVARDPDGLTFLVGQLEREPDARLRLSILAAAETGERSGRDAGRLTAGQLEIIRRHASADPDPKVAAAALSVIHIADLVDERALLEARRKLGDAAELRDVEWSRYAWFGEVRNPLFSYDPPPPFAVAPPDRPVRVLAFGDFGTGSEGQVQDARAMAAYHREHRFDFGLTLGDNFYSSGLSSPDSPRWQTQWEQLYGPLGIRFYPVFGNHDYGNPDSPAAELAYTRQSRSWVFPAPYYTFTAGAAQFFAIDNIRLTDSELAWLDDALARSTARWKIVYGHYHIYSATRGDNGGLIDRLLPVLERHHVQIYLNGHDHNMQEARTDSPVHFFTCGAGGAGLYDMQPTYKRSVFRDRQFGFAVLEIDAQHVDVVFVDRDGKEVYRSHIAS